MKARVSDQGVLIPKEFLNGVREVLIRREADDIGVSPVPASMPKGGPYRHLPIAEWPMKSLTFELPIEIYETLEEMAAKDQRDVKDVCLEWMAKMLPKPRAKMTPEEEEEADRRFRSHFGAIDSGDPHSADNERIDADLAREYGSA